MTDVVESAVKAATEKGADIVACKESKLSSVVVYGTLIVLALTAVYIVAKMRRPAVNT